MTVRSRTIGAGLALLLAASGCAGPATVGLGSRRPAEAPPVQPKWESCASAAPEWTDAQDALQLPFVDEGFTAVSAVVCRTAPQRRASGGEDMVALEERSDDVTALMAALRLPDEKPTDMPCTAELPFVPWLAVLDAQGRWVRPGVPVDACGKPRIEFRTAYEQLKKKRVTSRVLNEIESDEAAASGCAQTWGDMVWVTGQIGGAPAKAAPALAADDAEVKFCVYRVPASEQGSGKPAGEFERGGVLPAVRWTALKKELATAGPAAACDTPGSRFAVLHMPAAGEIYVEADGCRRVLIESGPGPSALLQGTPGMTALIFEE